MSDVEKSEKPANQNESVDVKVAKLESIVEKITKDRDYHRRNYFTLIGLLVLWLVLFNIFGATTATIAGAVIFTVLGLVERDIRDLLAASMLYGLVLSGYGYLKLGELFVSTSLCMLSGPALVRVIIDRNLRKDMILFLILLTGVSFGLCKVWHSFTDSWPFPVNILAEFRPDKVLK